MQLVCHQPLRAHYDPIPNPNIILHINVNVLWDKILTSAGLQPCISTRQKVPVFLYSAFCILNSLSHSGCQGKWLRPRILFMQLFNMALTCTHILLVVSYEAPLAITEGISTDIWHFLILRWLYSISFLPFPSPLCGFSRRKESVNKHNHTSNTSINVILLQCPVHPFICELYTK